jgi:hypothetical protein
MTQAHCMEDRTCCHGYWIRAHFDCSVLLQLPGGPEESTSICSDNLDVKPAGMVAIWRFVDSLLTNGIDSILRSSLIAA